jgi:hypothetical protein
LKCREGRREEGGEDQVVMKFSVTLKLETLRRIQAWRAKKLTLTQDRDMETEMLG